MTNKLITEPPLLFWSSCRGVRSADRRNEMFFFSRFLYICLCMYGQPDFPFFVKDKGLLRARVLLRMAEAARELGDADWALELHSVALRSTSVTGDTKYMWQDVVRVLTKSGRLEEAAGVLQVRGKLSGFVLLHFP